MYSSVWLSCCLRKNSTFYLFISHSCWLTDFSLFYIHFLASWREAGTQATLKPCNDFLYLRRNQIKCWFAVCLVFRAINLSLKVKPSTAIQAKLWQAFLIKKPPPSARHRTCCCYGFIFFSSRHNLASNISRSWCFLYQLSIQWSKYAFRKIWPPICVLL